MSYTHIKPGEEIEVVARQYISFAKGTENRDRMLALVKLSIPELEQLKAASIEAEQAIYDKFAPIAAEWSSQAGETVMLKAAMEYLATPQVSHTANKEVEKEHGWHEISNMVYKLHWRVYAKDWYRRPEGTPIPYELSWYLSFNSPRNADTFGSGGQIAGQERKNFSSKETMDKYLRGRIKAYSHLFTEISPPIPQDKVSRFSVHGILLPGYTVEVPELTPEQAAENLLAFLEDGDALPPTPSAGPSPAPKKQQPHKAKKHTPAR